MPHLLDLTSDLQNVLDKNIIGPVRVKMILDPDDQNIDLSDYIDRVGSIIISKKKSIQPYGDVGRYSASEMNVRMIDKNGYINPCAQSSVFYYATSRLYAAKGSSENFIEVPKGDGGKFVVGGKLIIREGDDSSTHTVYSIDTTTYPDYDKIQFSGPAVPAAYNAGALVETLYMPGKPVVFKNSIDNATTEISQFKGILKELPNINPLYASINLHDNFKKLLEIDLKANDYRIITDGLGGYNNPQEYSRADAGSPSNGELDLSLITIDDSKCKIGEWNILFTSDSEDFTLTDPDGIEYTGDTSTPFYVGSSSNYQIYIPTSAWSGSFVTDDEISFQTTCSLGQPANSYNTIPRMIYRLLIEDFGADLTSSDLNESTFTDLISDYDEMRGGISFTQPTTVLKAIELLQQHINGTLFHDNDGKFSISVYRPQLEPSVIRSLSPDADIRELEWEDLGRIERIFVHYNYDHDNGEYLGQIVIPTNATGIGPHLDVYFPAYHADGYGQAKAAGERIYLMWRRGVKAYEIREKYNTGIAFDLNEIYQISSQHPTLVNRVVEIFEFRKDILKGDLVLKAYDLNYVFGHYCFCDVDYCDRGKMTW